MSDLSPDLSQTAVDSGGGGGEATVLDYKNLVFPFCILGAGIVASAFLIFCESTYRFIGHYLHATSRSKVPRMTDKIKRERRSSRIKAW